LKRVKTKIMNLEWEKVCNPKSWGSLTENERAEVMLFMNRTSYTVEEVNTMLEEQRKFIASRFQGQTTLISNKVCESRILSSHEYVLNLRLGIRK